VEKLIAKITTDMQNKKPVNQSEFYTLTNLLKYLPDLVKFELKQQSQTPKPTGQLSEVCRLGETQQKLSNPQFFLLKPSVRKHGGRKFKNPNWTKINFYYSLNLYRHTLFTPL